MKVLTLNATQTGATNYQWFQDGNPVGTNNPTFFTCNYSGKLIL